MRIRTGVLCLLMATPSAGETPDIDAIVDEHILSLYFDLAETSGHLERRAMEDCDPKSGSLLEAYLSAFDAWVAVSHLRFGPSEVDNRAFALAFWPDPRGKTPKTLGTMIRAEDTVIDSPDEFATVSVASRGFYALEFLLFDPNFQSDGKTEYSCDLIKALALDIAATSAAIHEDWVKEYASLMKSPGQDQTYRDTSDVLRQLFTALSTGLEFTSEMRLGRPLGTFDRPRPRRAEARRSGRSQRHVLISLAATRDLAMHLSDDDPGLDALFQRASEIGSKLDDPDFAGVSDPMSRFRVEALKSAIDDVRRAVMEELGTRLGVSAGFNSLDGD